MYANYRLQGRPAHLLNRSSPQTSPTTLPTPQSPTPGVASRRPYLWLRLYSIHSPDYPADTQAQERGLAFQGRVERGGGGSPRKRPGLVSSLALSQGKPAQRVPASVGVSGGRLLGDKELGGCLLTTDFPTLKPAPTGCFPGVFRVAGWWLPAG